MVQRSAFCRYVGDVFPTVDTSGCIDGDGSPSNPIFVKITPDGGVFCGPSGLYIESSGSVSTLSSSGSTIIHNAGDGSPDVIVDVCELINSGCGATVSFTSGGLTISGTDGTSERVDICCVSGLTLSGQQITLTETVNGVPVEYNVNIPSGSVSSLSVSGSVVTHNDGEGNQTQFDICSIVNTYCPSGIVDTSGCITGDGSSGFPIALNLDPSGGLVCGDNGLSLVDSSGICLEFSYESGNAPSGASAPSSPQPGVVDGTIQIEVWDDCINYWSYNGSWTLDKQFCDTSGSELNSVSVSGCVSGDGTSGSPISVDLDPDGNIYCGSSGLFVSGLPDEGLIFVSTSGCFNGSGTPEAPLSVDLDPNGNIFCGDDGLYVSGIEGGGSTQSWTNETYTLEEGQAIQSLGVTPSDSAQLFVMIENDGLLIPELDYTVTGNTLAFTSAYQEVIPSGAHLSVRYLE